MRRAGRFEKGVKLPLDFTHRIRYNKSRSKNDAPVCRNGRRGGLKIPCANNTCGFDPHHRHKKETPSACLGEFLFYLRRVSGSNSTALLCRASDQPCGLSLSARETPTTGIKKRTSPACLGEFSFLSAACEHDLVVCIGRDRHAGLHHFQPVHEKIVEKYRMMTLPIS